MNYDVDHFIRKFESIPEFKWCTGDLIKTFQDTVLRCAAGFCGVTVDGIDIKMTEEGICLGQLLSPLFGNDNIYPSYVVIYKINDSGHPKYKQQTPKQRILAALYDIKKMQEPKSEFIPITYTKVIEKEVVGAV